MNNKDKKVKKILPSTSDVFKDIFKSVRSQFKTLEEYEQFIKQANENGETKCLHSLEEVEEYIKELESRVKYE
jgi:hypothetical protein